MQINDGRVIATVGRNSVTGDSGGVLLTPAGTLDGAWLTYDWNTTGLKRGSTLSLVVRAYDAAGNTGLATVVVRIGR